MIVAEVLGIVVDAVHRLDGYEDAYGLTMLRLYSTWFAVWLGAVFVAVGVAVATDYRGRRWLAAVLTALALGGVLVANVADPERVVADRNVSGPTKEGETDWSYLVTRLGDDALPTIDERFGELAPNVQEAIVEGSCLRSRRSTDWYNPNRTFDRAAAILQRWCGDAS